jgi:hypothetical protein
MSIISPGYVQQSHMSRLFYLDEAMLNYLPNRNYDTSMKEQNTSGTPTHLSGPVGATCTRGYASTSDPPELLSSAATRYSSRRKLSPSSTPQSMTG